MSNVKRLGRMFATTAKAATVHYLLTDSNATNREQRRKLERDHKKQMSAEKALMERKKAGKVQP